MDQLRFEAAHLLPILDEASAGFGTAQGVARHIGRQWTCRRHRIRIKFELLCFEQGEIFLVQAGSLIGVKILSHQPFNFCLAGRVDRQGGKARPPTVTRKAICRRTSRSGRARILGNRDFIAHQLALAG
nr:hypothetical protein [Mesorhizobium ciceri]